MDLHDRCAKLVLILSDTLVDTIKAESPMYLRVVNLAGGKQFEDILKPIAQNDVKDRAGE